MKSLVALLMLVVACQARPDAGQQVNILEKVQQLNHTIVNAGNELRETLGLPTQEEALNLVTQQATAFKTKIGEITSKLQTEAEKHQGVAAENLQNLAANLTHIVDQAATSLNLQDQLNSFKTAINNIGQQWQDIAHKTSDAAQEAWAPVQAALAEGAERTKAAVADVQSSIQSAVQKPAN